MYDKNRLIQNIHVLSKARKIKLGELESSCGVSVGYLARLRQGSDVVSPGADFLMSVAERLSVTVDALLSFDFTPASDADRKLQNYMEKLRLETEMRKLIWRQDLSVASPAHPLYTNKEVPLSEAERAESDLPVDACLSEVVFQSSFRPEEQDLSPAEIYRCAFPGNRVLYLVAVVKPGPVVPGPAQWTELELVMAAPDPVPLAHTDHEKPGCLDKVLTLLYTTVKESVLLPKLTPEASAIIDDYLK